jgi:hypothetical protein
MATEYKAVATLSVPRYDSKGEVTNRNDLVRAGDTLRLDPDLHAEFLQRGLESGAIREVEVAEPQQPEEGSEVNGPGTAALTTFPTPVQDESDGGEYPVRPGPNESTEKWREYAESRGIDGSGKRSEIQARVQEADQQGQ